MLNCEYCHTRQRKFYCTTCIKEKLQKHGEELDDISTERTAAISQAKAFVQSATVIQQLLAEKNKRALRLDSIQQSRMKLTSELNKKKAKVKELQKQITEKQKALEKGFQRKAHYKHPFAASTVPDTSLLKAWQRTHKMTVGTRRILVKEVSSLFELKPGVVEEVELIGPPHTLEDQNQHLMTRTSAITAVEEAEVPPFSQTVTQIEAKEDLYICGVTLPTRLIDVSKYPKEELNAPIGLAIHMLGLIVRYLGIKLPFLIFHRGIRPYIRMMPPNTRQLWDSYQKMPLFLEEDDKNFKRFVIGMAMLNYNLAYLCYTQNVKIPLSQVANTLQSLMACCRAPDLGLQSHASCYQGLRDMNFPLEFQQVLRATTLRYRCTSQHQQQQGHQQLDSQQAANSSMASSSQSEDEHSVTNSLYERHSRRRLRSYPLTYFLQHEPASHPTDNNSEQHYYWKLKKAKKRKSSPHTDTAVVGASRIEAGDHHRAHDIVSDDNNDDEAGYSDEDEDGFEVEYHYYLESEDDEKEQDIKLQRSKEGNDFETNNTLNTHTISSSFEQQVRPPPSAVVSETAATAAPPHLASTAQSKNTNEAWSIVEVAPSFYEYYRK